MKEQIELDPEDIELLNLERPYQALVLMDRIIIYNPGVGRLNLMPNLPTVIERIKPYIVKEGTKWILTQDLPEPLFQQLYQEGLVPFSNLDTFSSMMLHSQTQKKLK